MGTLNFHAKFQNYFLFYHETKSTLEIKSVQFETKKEIIVKFKKVANLKTFFSYFLYKTF